MTTESDPEKILGFDGLHCGLRGAKTGTKMPYDDFFLEVKYIS